MEYNDDQLIFTNDIENMASQYSKNLKTCGFIFVNIEEESQPLEMLTHEIGEILSIILALKRITISKCAFRCFAMFEKELIELWGDLTTDDVIKDVHRMKINNYCDGLRILIQKICEVASNLLQKPYLEKQKLLTFLLEKISEMTMLFGNCKYRLMID